VLIFIKPKDPSGDTTRTMDSAAYSATDPAAADSGVEKVPVYDVSCLNAIEDAHEATCEAAHEAACGAASTGHGDLAEGQGHDALSDELLPFSCNILYKDFGLTTEQICRVLGGDPTRPVNVPVITYPFPANLDLDNVIMIMDGLCVKLYRACLKDETALPPIEVAGFKFGPLVWKRNMGITVSKTICHPNIILGMIYEPRNHEFKSEPNPEA